MNNRVRDVREYVEGLYVPGYSEHQHDFIIKWLTPETVKLRKITKDDEGVTGLDILIIDTVGKGVARSFRGYRMMKADFARIGKKYADVYIHQPDGIGYPTRIDIESEKFSIILK